MNKKWLLVAINARYSHTSLSVRSISSYVKAHLKKEIPFMEFTINDEYFYILNEILKTKPDVIGFSCYIWNIELIKSLVKDIKSIAPETTVFLGGPEVSYNENVFTEIPDVEFVIKGEGEIPVLSLLKGDKDIKGVWYKGETAEFSDVADMADIPFCYSDKELETLKDKAVYYETSRGCPFKCAFCISSLTEGVRTLPLERVFKEIDIFINAGIKRVKLVDRTFNFSKDRAKKIISYILEKSKNTCFHFEIGADLLDDELVNIILSAKKDVIQLEAGVQSTNNEALTLCDRKTDMEKLNKNLKALSESEIRIHLDLIAGLPKEDYKSFIKSFDDVYSLKPKVLQVGFLKLLHGSRLRLEKEKYGYKFKNSAPYEILKNDFISFSELIKIKKVDKSVEAFHNSGMFKNSLSRFFEKYDVSPFLFFYTLGENMGEAPLSLKDKYIILYNTYIDTAGEDNEIKELLKLDFVSKQRGALLEIFDNYKDKESAKRFMEFLENEDNIKKYFPKYCNKKPKEIIKYIDFEIFNFNGERKIFAFNRENETVTELKSI